ncbi:hypothetical protein CPB97_000080 [Podila verticillata]|nr:hypothetical protein CPB97_000080 [Podila verticillata]
MSVLFGRKTSATKWSNINYPRFLVILLYLVSWVFTFMAAELVQHHDFNLLACTLSIYTCVVLYASSKVIIYLFLMEKVYVVTCIGISRKASIIYRINIGLTTPFIVIVYLMATYEVAELDPQGTCFIGLQRASALPLIIYDIFLSSWLTFLFIRPLVSSNSLLQGPSRGNLRQVARRTLVGAIVATVLSSSNIFTLAYFEGHELGLVCLSCCTADVTLNAMTIHWATSRGSVRSKEDNGTDHATGPSALDNKRRTNQGVISAVSEKRVDPLSTHISITAVESYEDYQSSSTLNKAV